MVRTYCKYAFSLINVAIISHYGQFSFSAYQSIYKQAIHWTAYSVFVFISKGDMHAYLLWFNALRWRNLKQIIAFHRWLLTRANKKLMHFMCFEMSEMHLLIEHTVFYFIYLFLYTEMSFAIFSNIVQRSFQCKLLSSIKSLSHKFSKSFPKAESFHTFDSIYWNTCFRSLFLRNVVIYRANINTYIKLREKCPWVVFCQVLKSKYIEVEREFANFNTWSNIEAVHFSRNPLMIHVIKFSCSLYSVQSTWA